MVYDFDRKLRRMVSEFFFPRFRIFGMVIKLPSNKVKHQYLLRYHRFFQTAKNTNMVQYNVLTERLTTAEKDFCNLKFGINLGTPERCESIKQFDLRWLNNTISGFETYSTMYF